MARTPLRLALPFFIALGACHSSGVRAPARAPAALAPAESMFQKLHAVKDRIGVTSARGASADTDGTPLAELRRRYAETRAPLASALASVDSRSLGAEDQRALAAMRAALAGGLSSDADATASSDAGAEAAPVCDYDAAVIARGDSAYERLRARMYACYTRAVQHVQFEGKTLDRLTALGMLAEMNDRERRHRLFLAIDTIWRSMNGDDGARSPYREFVKLSAARWRANGSPVDEEARVLRIDPVQMERWLVSVLDAWRASTPDSMIEPWDWHYQAGAASRALSGRIPLDSLGVLNARYFRDLGADVARLHVHYDLTPRAGKTPVAFTDFGGRPHLVNGAWQPGEPWVFATYRVGGLDNLDELLHETGHAVHISAIHQRPAFLDWPDNDALTEGLGDVAALEVYEPRWQMHYLGDSVPTSVGLRGRYGGVVLDIAWSLFEVRMHRDPGADPNQVWGEITSRYLHITPHPELSWWAMRGQLIDEPGYMANYAIGSIIIADIRARVRELHGDFTTGDPTWYAFMSDHIYRFGQSRTSADVIADFLGRPISAEAILADMRRMKPAR
ncbi:MAG: hypothetical protein JJD97_07905 [Gemmatimonadaceae bacterium]|nr:hypothetical protein [Gemmatimonadaceae bacterium]